MHDHTLSHSHAPHGHAPHGHGHDHTHAHDHSDHHGHTHGPAHTLGSDPDCDHVFGQHVRKAGEGRTAIVVGVTLAMMAVEIGAGAIYNSMALVADGLHMATHALALGVTLITYRLVRSWAADRRFSFGAGKLNALSGFSSALMLLGIALVMAVESLMRLASPVAIQFDQALIVAVLGLAINGVSALVLGHGHGEGHDHGHDHNLRAAYLHVLADAATSVLAICALLAGKWLGQGWLDPAIGVVGAVIVAQWSYGLIKQTGGVLLDHQVPRALMEEVRDAIEGAGEDRLADLHIWAIGPGIHAAELVIRSPSPLSSADYRARLPHAANIVHAVIEVQAG